LDFDQQVKIIELLEQMTFNRLKIYAEPQVIRKAAEHSTHPKEEIDKLKRAGGKWQFQTDYDSKGEKRRVAKRKEKDELEIVV
jgi:hypothetical protein